MASILLVVKGWQHEQQIARDMARIALETSTSPEDGESYRTTAAGDSRKLRGIPAIGRSVAGAVDGTTPGADAHLDRLDG